MLLRARGNRGVSIAVALLVLVIISVIALAIASAGSQNLALANNDRTMLRCRYAAEAGIADAENALINNNAWNSGFSGKALLTDSDMKYNVTITNNHNGSGNVTAPDGTVVPQGMVYLVSTGYFDKGGVNVSPRRTIGCLLAIASGPVFPYGAFGLNNVYLGGTSAIDDAWDSSAGPYSATKMNSNSDVGTNSTDSKAIEYSGGAKNWGNVYIGPGGNPSVVQGQSGSNYSGSIERLDRPFVVPVPTAWMIPSYTDLNYTRSHDTVVIEPGAYHDLNTATQNEVYFKAGTYYFSGNVKFGSQNKIYGPSTGTVKIYVDGTWDSGGGAIVNPQAIPATFQLYGTASCTTVTINGGNDAYYLVNAPAATVTVQGNSSVYGAIIGSRVNVQGGAQIHYDIALKNLGPQRPAIIRRAWKYI